MSRPCVSGKQATRKNVAKSKPGSVVFVNPPGPARLYRSSTCTYVSKANYIWQPQDFISLSALVPRDRELSFLDCSVNGWDEALLFSRIEQAGLPDVAVIALSSIVYEQDILFLKHFRARFPSVRLLALSDLFLEKAFWDRGLAEADGIILNPLDIDLEAYIRTGSTASQNLVLRGSSAATAERPAGKAAQRVSVGLPRHELFLSRNYRFPFAHAYLYSTVSTQYGCPFQCQYCTQCKIPVTYRGHEEVLAELEHISRLGVREIFFGDPSFGFPRENAEQFLEGMLAKGLQFGWSCYANPGLIDRPFLELMKRAGCHTAIIGIEDEDMVMLRERYKRNLTESRLLEFTGDCRELKVRVCGDFIIGLNSDKEAVDRMVAFARRLDLDYASFNLFIPLFGSAERERLVREGALDPYAVGFDTSGTFGKDHTRLLALRDMAVRKFYLRPSYIWKRLSTLSGREEFMIHFQEMTEMLKHNIFGQHKAS